MADSEVLFLSTWHEERVSELLAAGNGPWVSAPRQRGRERPSSVLQVSPPPEGVGLGHLLEVSAGDAIRFQESYPH